MRLETLKRKVLKGASGKFTTVKVGELPKLGDVQIGEGWVTDIDETQLDKPVKAGEAIIRLEIDK